MQVHSLHSVGGVVAVAVGLSALQRVTGREGTEQSLKIALPPTLVALPWQQHSYPQNTLKKQRPVKSR